MDNLVALLGMPRSGTTIISRLIANHTMVHAVVEPYHRRRAEKYGETDLAKLCDDFSVPATGRVSILVKETFTREQNILLLRNLLQASSAEGLRSAHILVLRSPIEAFLSQVEASQKYWKRKADCEPNSPSVKAFWTKFRKCIECYLSFALLFDRRVIVYDRFVRWPREEIAGAMSLFGYPTEESQFDVTSGAPEFGGDPKARAPHENLISSGDRFRTEEVSRFIQEAVRSPAYGGMMAVHNYVKAISESQPSSESIAGDLARLAGLVRASRKRRRPQTS